LDVIRDKAAKKDTVFKEKTRIANQPRVPPRKYVPGEQVLLLVQGLPGKLKQA